MKKFVITLTAICIAVGAPLFAQTIQDDFSGMGAWKPAYGAWKADGKLTQSNLTTGLAQIYRQVPQSGVYELEFTAKYKEGGYKDLKDAAMGKYHAGFGIHIGIDKPAPSISWGNGKSYLLWFNLDTTVPKNSEYYGLRAQVYKSDSNSRMNLMKDYNVEILPQDVVTANLDYLAYDLKVRMIVNTNDGEIRVYDPTVDNYYYYFTLDPKVLRAGSYVAFRTNRVGIAFDDFKVTRIR